MVYDDDSSSPHEQVCEIGRLASPIKLLKQIKMHFDVQTTELPVVNLKNLRTSSNFMLPT